MFASRSEHGTSEPAVAHREPASGVREHSATPAGYESWEHSASRPAHPSNRVIAKLNASWRIADDPLQWILQRRKGNTRSKNPGWAGRSYCRTRDALLRCIRQNCGQVSSEALAKLEALPYWHPDWDRRVERTNLDVRETSRVQGTGGCRTLYSSGVGRLSGLILSQLAAVRSLFPSYADENSIIQVKTETKKEKSDTVTVTFALLARLAGAGFTRVVRQSAAPKRCPSTRAQSAVINEIGTTCDPFSQIASPTSVCR